MVVLILMVLALVAFWCYQLVLLMTMEDNLFPGKFDKPIWAALFLLLAPLAPFLFLLWRQTVLVNAQKDGHAGTR